jgi:type IV pilus assembly protein PilW
MYDCELSAMKNKFSPPRPSPLRQHGLSLIELLVAMTITMLIVVAASSVYLVARQGFRSNDDNSRSLENGRFAIDILTRNIRMAGSRDFDIAGTNTDRAFEVPGAPGVLPVSGTEGGANPDTVSIAYLLGQDVVANAALLSATDCLGQSVAVSRVVVNTFSISADGQLQCSGSGAVNVTLPLVGPVVDLQVTYNVDPDPSDLYESPNPSPILREVDASGITALTAVRSVNICIDVASFEVGLLEGASFGNNCRNQPFAADRRVHRIYRTTVNVRNASKGSSFVNGI